ncbi:MAG: type VI secretion protein IcmF/TssM N-terminal domain-containing protein [Desulfovibrionaceae bacterium]|nr:type VI secretion protein IcmF/TssM N-terminal domain-containing protein [Desulfovibrionaceae bacterium]
MNRVLGFLIRILVIMLILALLGGAGWLLHYYCGWTWQSVAVLGLALAAVVIVAIMARYIHYKRREKRFLKRMVEHDNPSLTTQGDDESLARLRERWRTGIRALENSVLPDHGSAIYSLPWFMLFGESGSGKSTAVLHSRLGTFSGWSDASSTKPASTRNCDWWFFKNAVVIDTAGHYAVPQNNGQESREWQEFVSLLAAYRRKEPLNGLILTLSTEQLQRGQESLIIYGHTLRTGIHTLARAMGASFPVYILVTKVDRILGFNELGALLSNEECNQALGLLNPESGAAGHLENMAFLEKALAHTSQRLQDLSMLFCAEARQNASRIAALPAELAKFFPAIRAFTEAVFAPGTYDEPQSLRGIFFSSGRQEGSVTSNILSGLQTFKDTAWALPGTNKSLFLRDFFSCILPKDRPLSDIADRWLSRQSFRRYRPYMCYLLFMLLLCAYFTLSFKIHMDDMLARQKSIPAAITLDANLNKRVEALSVAADTIQAFEKDVQEHRFLKPGRIQAQQVLDSLKHNYVAWVRPNLIFPETDKLDHDLLVMPRDKARHFLVSFCDYNSWLNTVIDRVRTGADLPPVSDQTDEMLVDLQEYLPYCSVYLRNVLASYASWEDPQIRDTILADKSSTINAYLHILGTNLDWLTEWLNLRPGVEPVKLTSFWPKGPAEPFVPPAYTVAGFNRMESILNRLRDTVDDNQAFSALEEQYRNDYADALRASWWQLAEAFPLALQNNISRDSWSRLNLVMAGYDNPYYAFVTSMARAFKKVADKGRPNMEDTLILAFADLVAYQKKADKPDTLDKKLIQKKEELTASLSEKHAQHLHDRNSASKELAAYHDALADLRQNTETSPKAMTMMASVFKGGSQSSETALIKAIQAAEVMQLHTCSTYREHEAFWRLIKGPLAWYTYMAVIRSACELNASWNETVLSPITMMPQESVLDMIYDEQSPINKFIQGPCQPFLSMASGGFAPATWHGLRFPLKQEFLSFLDQKSDPARKAKEKYVVGITALPVNVNDMAAKPHRARLRLECGDQTQILDNYNYEVSTKFTWEPAICGKVSLEFTFDSQTVTTTWEDEWAFQTFLKDFSGGEVLLTPEDFPGQEEVLNDLDVKEIRVRYSLSNVNDALMAERTPTTPLPAEAAMCTDKWDDNIVFSNFATWQNELPLTVHPKDMKDSKKGKKKKTVQPVTPRTGDSGQGASLPAPRSAR